MKNIGVAFAGGHGARRADDFYPTPPDATRALLPLIAHWPRNAWEPCCGNGAISEVLRTAGFCIFSSDIVDRGYGDDIRDFFAVELCVCDATTVITNPPFNRAEEFIGHARKLGMERMALLLKVSFWSARKRLSTFQEWPPSSIHPLTWRLDFDGRGAPTMDVMWCLWEPGSTKTRYEPIARPVSETEDWAAELVA